MHSWVDHTSELELSVDADTPEAVVVDATEAVGEVLGDPLGDPEQRRVSVAAPGAAALLAAWLDELVFLSERELIAVGASDVRLGARSLEATVTLRPGVPSELVKAVTYHRLSFEPASGGGWHATAVLDV